MKEIKLPCYNVIIRTNNGGGSIETGELKGQEFDVLTSLILAHACAGIDVASPAYVEGIETVVDVIVNNT